MQVHYSLESFPKLSFPVVTTGTFDGVHLGHQTILNRLQELARKYNGQSVVITFHPHPRQVLRPDDHSLQLLTTLPEKIARLEVSGIDHLLVIPFNKEFAELSSQDFIRQVIVEAVNTRKLVIGYDHHFGKNREGSFEHLRQFGPQYGFEVEEIPAQDIDQVAVSSTKIREALSRGDIHTANRYLGYAYPFNGKVVRGKQLGRTIGFPTANLELEGLGKLIPANGVYAVMVNSGSGIFNGMMNIGFRPTVSDEKVRSIEVHLLDFEGDLYEQNMKVKLIARIRDEKRFASVDELRDQLKLDRVQALKYLSV
ncbi:MAG TPA: bifunctional riboflavin kinase/FAD synthetase [Flavobacteriales bacterium]|nr:bifunctional riboflavin kinase/FAD synthetase [Flavobacteriales bacterium]HPH82967.1 bifunctional riboflavin kinase/FAD synthetase [Flavobacteriales bacterium]